MIPLLADVALIAPALARAAQETVDAWRQDEDGVDVELGSGGACDLVADAMRTKLAERWPDLDVQTTWSDVECHTSLVALLADCVGSIDVPARAYETGAGYVWRKIPKAAIGPDDVIVETLDRDVANWTMYVDD